MSWPCACTNGMATVADASSLLAQSRFSEIQRGFEETQSSGSLVIFATAAVVVVVLTPVSIALVLRVRERLRQPQRLAWRGMSQALGLNWSERRLLAQVARQRGLHPTAALLISRGAFESAVTAYLAQGAAPERSKAQLQRLRKRIFS